jgi:hypothetical protein
MTDEVFQSNEFIVFDIFNVKDDYDIREDEDKEDTLEDEFEYIEVQNGRNPTRSNPSIH